MREGAVARALLKEVPLKVESAARMMLEMKEELAAAGLWVPDGAGGGCGGDALMALMRRVIRAGVEVVRMAQQTVSFAEAAWASVEARRDRRAVTQRDLRTYVRRMLRVEGVGERPLRAMQAEECRALLRQAFAGSPHAYRKGRAILHSIFAYGFRREWCDGNPVDRIEAPRVEEREIRPLSVAEVRRLQEVVRQPKHEAMRLSLHLMLYCGIRPAEVRRLNPETDIDWQERQVIIRPGRSKTGGGRVVPLRGASWLLQGGGLLTIPRNWERRWGALRREVGFRGWPADVLRHTFASNHAAYYRNLPALQLEMGHRDLSLLSSRYVNPLHGSRREVREFWRAIGE